MPGVVADAFVVFGGPAFLEADQVGGWGCGCNSFCYLLEAFSAERG